MSINPRLCYGVSAEKSCLLFLTQSPQRTFKIQKRRDRRERAALRSLPAPQIGCRKARGVNLCGLCLPALKVQ